LHPLPVSLVVGVLAIAYAVYLACRVLAEEEGTGKVKEIAEFIREGARAYMKKQYTLIAVIVSLIALALLVLIGHRVALSYAVGAASSSLTGFIGLHTAIRANSRTATAASKSLEKALGVAFKGGAVLGFSVVGVGLMCVGTLYFLYGGLDPTRAVDAATGVLGFSFGASTVALFARVGGGIYTKAADIGADLVGKVEKGIPEDDPRNPGVIADNVGDNVGDVAGMGADLFESYVGALISAIVLGAVLYVSPATRSLEWVFLPLAVSAVGIIASIIATLSVKGDPEKALIRASIIATALAAVFFYVVTSALLKDRWMGPYIALLSGLAVSIVVGGTCDYFTSEGGRPVRKVAAASQAGPALNILEGVSIGFVSTFMPVVAIAIAELVAFIAAGIYGVAISAIGMLSIAGVIVAADAYGPIADNAAGIAEQAGLGAEVRRITDKLDAVGNAMKSICKGFAVGSAALTAIAFFATLTQIPAFSEYVARAGGIDRVMSLLNARTFSGLLIGSAIPALSTALIIFGVSDGALKMVDEIRRQFREIPGLMEGRAKPDYAKCVAIATKNALKKLILPSAIAIIAPITLGLLLGPEALVGMIAGAIVVGLLLGLFQGNVGNTWDNAKKYVEEGRLGGKGSFTHAATVIGDTCGDPMKDSSGPAQNIFIKLMSITSVVFAPLIVRFFIGI